MDIREQYPLFPTSDLQQITHARSIRYPKFAGTDLAYVLTTDFLVTFKASNGTTQLAARTVKYSDALQPSKSLERTLQKLEIERYFWTEQGVDWGIVTELSIPRALSENLQWLRLCAVVDKGLIHSGIQQRFVDALDRLNPADRILSPNIRIAGQAAHLHYKDAIQLFKHMVWHKSILLDLKTAPLRLTESVFRHVASTKMQLLQPALAALRSGDPKVMRRFDDLLPSEEHMNAMMLISGITTEVSFLRELRSPANVPIVKEPVIADDSNTAIPAPLSPIADKSQQAKELASQDDPLQALHLAGWMTRDALEFSPAYRLRRAT